jgi:hypothetical protein
MFMYPEGNESMANDLISIVQVASAPTQVLSPKRLRPASNQPLALTTPGNQTVVSTLPPVISSHILNNNYLLASQSAQAAVANFQHHHPLAPFHHPQHQPILQNLPSPALTQIKSIITASSPTATIPTQIPSFIATANAAQQQQQIKSINTSSSFNSPSPVATTVIPISQTQVVESSNLTSSSPSQSSTTTVATNTVTGSSCNANMDPVGQMGQNPMQSHPLSQSMDSVNTASNEEEVSHLLMLYNGSL